MKITCSKQQLTEAVSNVQRAVSTKSSIPALEGILLKAHGQEVTLCGYDLELGMTTTIEASVEEPGNLVLSARLFGDIVRRLPGEQVCIASDEKNITAITCGLSEFSIVGIPAEEYSGNPLDHRGDHDRFAAQHAQEHDPPDDLCRGGHGRKAHPHGDPV